ncbi:MAG: zinc ribbon domain-containing protein [Anaerolineae bacterium]
MTKINRTQVAVFAVVVLLVFGLGIALLPGLFGGGYGGWGPGGMMGPGMMGGRGPGMMGYGYGGGALGWLFSLLGLIFPLGFLALLVLGGIWLFRQVNQPQGLSVGWPQAQPSQTCPNCDQAVQTDWQLCPYCGNQLAQQA